MENKVLAVVAGEEITQELFDTFLQGVPREQQMYLSDPQFREQCFEQLVALFLFAKKGEEEKIDETEEFQKIFANAKRELMAQFAIRNLFKEVSVSEEEIKAYYDENQEQFKKDSRLIIPKLAFGNVKGLDEKVQMYDISFNLSNKELDITSQELQKSFPIVFGRKGLIQKRGYEIIPDGKGGLTYRIEKNEYTNLYNKEEQRENKLKETLKGEGVPTYEQQADNSKKFMENQKEINQYIQRSEEDKQL